jgi:hypothetical protein
MFAMYVPMPSEELRALATAASLLICLSTAALIGSVWLASKLSARLRRLVGSALVAVVVASTLVSAAEVPGLKCCNWIDLVWLCLDWWSC